MPIRLPVSEDAKRLREFFQAAGYSSEGVLQVFGSKITPCPNAKCLQPMLDCTGEKNLLNLLFRWFLIGNGVGISDAESLVDTQILDLLIGCGALQRNGQSLEPCMMIVPFRDLLVASDVYQKLHSAESYDYVLTVGPTADSLFNFVIRQECENALDLCSGCGVHGVSMGKHAKRVTTTDLNAYAPAFSSFNAALNGVTNVHCLAGDGFNAVAGEKFDLIVCNPPFVMSPSKEFLYRDNAMDLDQFVRGLVEQAPTYLENGGFFQMILEWVEVEGQTWQERLSSWFAKLPCDALVLLANTDLAETYAKKRVNEMHEMQHGDYADEVQEWTDYYRRFQVKAIHGGLIVLRRKNEPGWVRFERIAEDRGPIGDYVLATFAAEDFLRSHEGIGITDARFRLTDNLQLIQKSMLSNLGWQPVDSKIEFKGGWQGKVELDHVAANILAHFDGSKTVSELNQIFAESIKLDPANTLDEFCTLTKHLLSHGVLRIG